VAGAQVQRRQVAVSASGAGWTATGLVAARGDLIVVSATGRVEVTPGELEPAAARPILRTYRVDADGVGGSRRGDGTLELLVGAGAPTLVGVHGALFAAGGGPVLLRVRADNPQWNGGSFRIDVVLVPAELIPAAGPPDSAGPRRS
jgi:hypothetical protein